MFSFCPKTKKGKIATIISGAALLVSAGFIIGITGFFGQQTIPSDTMTRGLVGYWAFEEGSGAYAFNAAAGADQSKGKTFKSELNVGAGDTANSKWTSGKHGGALEFDGVNDYVDCGNDASLNITDAITIEA